MVNELKFKTNSQFKSVTYEYSGDRWHFSFTDNIQVSVTGFWRLLKENRIKFVSLDNGHQFGLPKPIDLVDEITKLLKGKNLTEIKVTKDTSDLILTISSDIIIEIYIASAGYETYDFSLLDKTYIGLGSGDIKIFDKKK